jgi:ribosomal protein S18 acetylase RimI-like enzyme
VEGARVAQRGDLEAMVDLAREAIAELAEQRGGSIWRRREARAEPLDASLQAVLDRPEAEGGAVVGTVDGTVVGYGTVRYETLHDGATLAVVDDLFVSSQARAIGIGEAMMDLLVEQARARGAVGIDALALPGDRHTKNFFETFGLTARAIVVHRSLVPADPAPVAAAAGVAAAEAPPVGEP